MSGVAYVARGAKVFCEEGTLVQLLDMPMSHGSYIKGKAQMRRDDCVPGINFTHFGVCKKKAATGAPAPACVCTPLPGPFWLNAHRRTFVNGVQALMANSFLFCYVGGIIRIIDDGIKEKVNVYEFIRRTDKVKYDKEKGEVEVIMTAGMLIHEVQNRSVYKQGEFIIVNGVPYIEKKLLEDQRLQVNHKKELSTQKAMMGAVVISNITGSAQKVVVRGGKVIGKVRGIGGSSATTTSTTGAGSQILSRGDKISKAILDTKPNYAPSPEKWLNKGGNIIVDEHGVWTYTNKNGQSVRYIDGYPDFSPYYHPTTKPVKIKVSNPADRPKDFRAANEAAGLNKNSDPPVPSLDKPPDGYSWHHVEDGKTMVLVKEDIHLEFTHQGGVSLVNVR